MSRPAPSDAAVPPSHADADDEDALVARAGALSADDVLAARARLGAATERTPVRVAPALAQRCGARDVWLKLDTLLPTGAFKERGALNALLMLSPEQARRGVVTASAGNHAQALAYHGGRLGVSVTVVMATHTPQVKIAGARRLGARVMLEGDAFDDALAQARRLEAEDGLTLVHPFDDAAVIAGQGVGILEFLEDAPDIDTLLIPVGGGGLIAGALLAAEAAGGPRREVLGVEPAMYPSMRLALGDAAALLDMEGDPEARHGVLGGHTIAEGVAVKRAGLLTAAVCRRFGLTAQDIVLVSEPAIEEAIVELAMTEKLVSEGAGALGLAAVIEHEDRVRERRVGLHVCGGNIDARLFAQVLARHLVRTRRRARLRVECFDRPGSLADVTAALTAEGVNIIDVLHNRMVVDVPAKETRVDFVIETDDAAITEAVVARLRRSGFPRARILDERE